MGGILEPSMDTPARAPFPSWLSFAVLGCAAAYLAARWDDLPARWATHWNAAGVPNGWAARTALGVYGPLLVGAGVLALLEALGAVASRRREGASMEAVRAATRHVVRSLMFAVSLVVALLAVDLPLGPSIPPGLLVGACLAIPAVSLAFATRRVSAAMREVRASGKGAKLEGYRGLYYANPADERLWVPKLSGLGTTINFAHRWAWPVMALLLGVPIAIVILLAVARGR